MKWFLLALVMYTNKPSPDVKIHAGLKFVNNENWQNYLKKYKSSLMPTSSCYILFKKI